MYHQWDAPKHPTCAAHQPRLKLKYSASNICLLCFFLQKKSNFKSSSSETQEVLQTQSPACQTISPKPKDSSFTIINDKKSGSEKQHLRSWKQQMLPILAWKMTFLKQSQHSWLLHWCALSNLRAAVTEFILRCLSCSLKHSSILQMFLHCCI